MAVVTTVHSDLAGGDLHEPKAHAANHDSGGSDVLTDLGPITMTGDLDLTGNVLYLNDANTNAIAEVGTTSIVTFVNGNYNTVNDSTGFISHVDCRPISNNTKDLGTSSYKWQDVYCVTLHQGDSAYSEQRCEKCGVDFKTGDNIIHRVINIDNDTVTIPIHLECANTPIRTITLQRAVKEDYYDFDSVIGEIITKKRNKTIRRVVIKKRLKVDVSIDTNGNFMKNDIQIIEADAIEEYEDIIIDVIYEGVEFDI